jgi:hypothetical protein
MRSAKLLLVMLFVYSTHTAPPIVHSSRLLHKFLSGTSDYLDLGFPDPTIMELHQLDTQILEIKSERMFVNTESKDRIRKLNDQENNVENTIKRVSKCYYTLWTTIKWLVKSIKTLRNLQALDRTQVVSNLIIRLHNSTGRGVFLLTTLCFQPKDIIDITIPGINYSGDL